MPAHLHVAACLATLALGCGARTGLDRPPPRDAGTDVFHHDAGPVVVIPEILVSVTVDNSYRFGFGDAVALRDAAGAAEAGVASDIFSCSAPCTGDGYCGGVRCGPLGACEDGSGPEVYRIAEWRATSADFLYVVAWSDYSVTQGLLAEIRTVTGRVVRSGDPGWSACATGRDYDTGSGGPPEAEIDEWLARCNRGDSPSGGWVTEESPGTRLAVGERNQGADGSFPETCLSTTHGDRIGADARWMWIDARSGDPFVTPQPEFLLFRLPTTALLGP